MDDPGIGLSYAPPYVGCAFKQQDLGLVATKFTGDGAPTTPAPITATLMELLRSLLALF